MMGSLFPCNYTYLAALGVGIVGQKLISEEMKMFETSLSNNIQQICGMRPKGNHAFGVASSF